MKKVEGPTVVDVSAKTEDDKPKKVRNRPLFHVKVSIVSTISIFL